MKGIRKYISGNVLWEDNVLNHIILKGKFLTKWTAKGLHITIKLVIDLSKRLLEECRFKYVLYSEINPDRLKVK